jgi:hypothetical protein
VKDALDRHHDKVKAGPDTLKVAKCPACGGIVELRGRRIGRNPDDRTWYYRHRRGEGRRCSRRPTRWQSTGADV